MTVCIHDDLAPILLVTFTGASTDEEFAGYIDAMTKWIHRDHIPGVLLDTSQAPILPKEHREMQVNWMNEHRTRLAELASPTAFVITNPAVRFVLSTIFLVAPMPGVHKVLGNRRDALDYLTRTLGDRGIETPPNVGELVHR